MCVLDGQDIRTRRSGSLLCFSKNQAEMGIERPDKLRCSRLVCSLDISIPKLPTLHSYRTTLVFEYPWVRSATAEAQDPRPQFTLGHATLHW